MVVTAGTADGEPEEHFTCCVDPVHYAFDQFTVDQIAGDLRPDATDDQIIATGFHRNTQQNREGGSDPEQYRVERVVDRVNTTGEVFLGLTVGCARCHDHKFDPIPTKDYYRIQAVFDSTQFADRTVPFQPYENLEPRGICRLSCSFQSSSSHWVISVSIKPGAIALTVMLREATSLAILRVKPIIPALADA